MLNRFNLLKSENFVSIFIIAHIVSFFSFFIAYSSGAIVSVITLLILLIHYRNFIAQLLKRENSLFFFLITIEFISLTNYFVIPESRAFVMAHPIIFFEALSYLIIPQIGFYYFGYLAGKSKELRDSSIRIILKCTLLFGILSLFLHFNRPTFFNNFIQRTLSEQYDYYGGFYPRLTGYLNSMIVGILCSGSMILCFSFFKERWLRILAILVFLGCVIFSLQRGAWASLVMGLLLLLSINIFRRPSKTLIRLVKFILIGALITISIYFISSNTNINIANSDLLSMINADMVNKINTFSEAASERAYQKDNFTYLISKYPMGMGLGLLSHKAADLGFQYATPDGNYFRIAGELGLLGGLVFILLLIVSLIKTWVRKEYTIFVATVLFAIQAYGTNVFDLYMCGFVFWFLMGMSFSTRTIVNPSENAGS